MNNTKTEPTKESINKAINYVNAALQEFTTSPNEQRKLLKYCNSLAQDFKDDKKAILRSLVGNLYDGLAYGNWIWIMDKEKD
jgi:uncharacterized coiled-coil DUF342 family protein